MTNQIMQLLGIRNFHIFHISYIKYLFNAHYVPEIFIYSIFASFAFWRNMWGQYDYIFSI